MTMKRSRAAILCGLILLLVATPHAWAQTEPTVGSKTHLDGYASAIVKLQRSGDPGEGESPPLDLAQRLPDGTIVLGPISVPAGAVFVLTDLECERIGADTTGVLAVTLRMPTSGEVMDSCRWDTNVEGLEYRRSWTTGEVLWEIPRPEFSEANTGRVRVRLRGYFAKDR
jgi:hypothetical protein